MWSTVMVVIEDVIKSIISEFVSWAITVWASAFATATITFGESVMAAMTLSVTKAATALEKVTKHLGAFGKLLDGFMTFMQKVAGGVATLTERFRVGKYVEKGERALPFIGAAPIGRIAEETSLTLSNRMASKTAGLSAGAGPLLKGVGAKAGIGATKGVAGETADEFTEDGPLFDKSEIGGDRNVADTREDLDI